MTAIEIIQQHHESLKHHFDQLFSDTQDAPPRLIEAIRYSLDAGGKRLRPVLILETFHLINNPQADPKDALTVGTATELIHTFSLVHDDLPAMDNDDFRRGKPTNHKIFGEALAILAGDAMMSLAFEWIAGYVRPHLVPSLIRELARATGPCGMIGGQVLDIENEHRPLTFEQLKQVHRLKTGALLTASCRMGALCAGASDTQLQAVTSFGQHLGLAFQIMDDILDQTSSLQQLGKATQKGRFSREKYLPRSSGPGWCTQGS
ncbi:MAG: hypothetical protein KatS3mg104_1134 [Phycisphaerae bacterium]|nr:MAG: hypothetical protein KatS3mg104_1134 [Phycisphaerae bacterium]